MSARCDLSRMLLPTVREVMSRPVVTVTADVGAREVARQLTEQDIGSLVVVEGEQPVGIVTRTDIVALFAAGDGEAVAVGEMMSEGPVTVEPAATLQEAASLLAEHAITKLPVVDDSRLVGIVTATDLSNYVSTGAMTPDEPVPRQRTRYRPDTAYEDDDWTVQSYGTEDGLDVGDRVSFAKTLDEDDVATFADASGDTNRLHLDESFAAGTRFGGRIVHGTLVVGVISAALARLPGLTIYISQQVTFTGPVEIGARVTARCSVVEELGRNRYRLTTTVETQDGETVLDGQATVLADPLPDI